MNENPGWNAVPKAPPPPKPTLSATRLAVTALAPPPTEHLVRSSTPRLPSPAQPPVQKVLATPAQCRVIPTFFMRLERSVALLTMNPDPLFDVHDAAEIVGLSRDSLDKRRQRGQPPDYIQYDSQSGRPGPVRYALSALMKFREDHTIYPSRKKQ